jgi:hypothetical protein
MERARVAEWLDSDQGSPEEVGASLRDLDHINRWFGGVQTTRSLLRKVARARHPQRHYSVLDVAGANSRVIALAAQAEHMNVSTTVVDLSASHLTAAHGVVADALRLPFADKSFDLVHCCLFLHHLSAGQAAEFLRCALGIARVAVLVNDLRRAPLHLLTVQASSPILFSRITRHDAAASVRNAYNESEMLELLRASAASRYELQRHFLYRFGGVLWV